MKTIVAFFNSLPVRTDPSVDLLFVFLDGLSLRPLGTPAHRDQHPRNVVVVVLNPELSGNDLQHPFARPKIAGKTSLRGTFKQNFLEAPQLGGGQFLRPPRGLVRLQTRVAVLAIQRDPFLDRAECDLYFSRRR